MNIAARVPALSLLLLFGLLMSCRFERDANVADTIIRNGVIYDGSGAAPTRGDLAIVGDRIVAVGELKAWRSEQDVDADGLAVAPGFINILSWANDSLLVDGRGLSDLMQGVTLEVFGEGWSMGPLNPAMKQEMEAQGFANGTKISWTRLDEYLEGLVQRGVSVNVASFVGAATVRIHELGYEDRPPTEEELHRMRSLVAQAMQDGALGVGSSLIYAPGAYADTDEIKALVEEAARYGGGYISHLRSEADNFLQALDELIDIGEDTGARVEAYHLKAAGSPNWSKMRQAIERIQQARDAGLKVGANMYPYTAGATGLTAAMPPWVQEGGLDAWVTRLKDPAIRTRVAAEMRAPGEDWENLLLGASADGLLLLGFRNEALKPLIGKTLADVATLRGTTPEETAMDLVIEDHSRVLTAYFLMSEDNVQLGLSQPWVGIGSDGGAMAPEGEVLESLTHPRAYGSFARFLGKYVRDEGVAPLADAIHRITGLQADNWGLRDRGCLKNGCFADVVVFDPETITDHATFANPHQLATGVRDVFVNGEWALKRGEVTAARAGQVVRGPGWIGEQ
ncbi:MAG: amidohydrolase family protein [Abyssibacter sp.]|nr:amidohydrolase family protein [Abyssibacter sp.]MCK5858256.1 amidohydrolase family protein [Abyssibacter sp.]